jgi:hypothetical protein
MNLRLRIVGVIFVAATGACHRNQAGNAADPENALRVLFIGNSLTQSNDLPAIVQALAAAGGQRPLAYRAIVVPGSSLEDQWNAGTAESAIRGQKWDFVVLQQGPSSLSESRTGLLECTRKFAKEIRAVGATPALYMVWPESTRPKAFDAVCESYRLAAKEVNGVLLPAGQAWRAAWRREPMLELYSDGLHPMPAGSYLAALTMYGQLYQQSPIGLPAKLVLQTPGAAVIDIPTERARLLQEAAAEAIAKFGKP